MRRRPLAAAAAWALLCAGAATQGAAAAPAGAAFVEAAGTGIDFVHFNGMSGELYFPEVVGGGAALLDFDRDGDLDVFFAQGRMLGEKPVDAALFPPRHPLPLTHRLYRNDTAAGPDGRRVPRFTDVSAAAGIPVAGYAMGVTAGDYDGDGRTDLYVTAFGPNQLLRNRGDGTFEDVTAAAGVQDERWSVPATFFDFDRDGHLDLYVGNYVAFTIAGHKPCFANTGGRDYCGPIAYPDETDRLFRNRGDGTFEDASAKSGVGGTAGPSLGSIAADFDDDGWPDLYVALDDRPNLLWRNRGDGTFEDVALLAGCSVNGEGQPEASMGVDAGDYDGDGDLDVFLTHLARQTNTLYANLGEGFFEDRSLDSGLGTPSWAFTGFGTAFLDYDNDSWLDVLAVNGGVVRSEEQMRAGDPYPLHQTNQLFHNRGPAAGGGAVRFAEVTAAAGESFARSEVSRGAAFGDLDDDGDLDVLVVNNNGLARLLLNQVGQDRRWLGLRLVSGGRDALGARVEVLLAGGRRLVRHARTDGSYASGRDPRVLFGLGDAPRVERVRVTWPGGASEEWSDLPLGAYTTLTEGSGRRPAPEAEPGGEVEP